MNRNRSTIIRHSRIDHLIPELKFPVLERRNLRNIDGPLGRINKLRKTVTALVQHERLELYSERADEARGYAERLISEAIRHGDTHAETMELASFWLLQKELVHKLFKVLVPRFQDCRVTYTKVYKAPNLYPDRHTERSVLELRGNPYPDLAPSTNNKYFLHNMLLDAARREHRSKEYSKIAEEMIPKVESTETTETTVPKETS